MLNNYSANRMSQELLNIKPIDIFVALVKKRQQLEEEYYRHPTKENATKVDSLRLQIRKYQELIQGNRITDIWN